MRRACLVLTLAISGLACQPPTGPELNMERVAVSAADRLKDYRAMSRYPDQSRPADASTPALANWPGMNGRRVSSARIIGWEGDEARAGSLFVIARVEVVEAGRYSFTTVLHDATSGEALATATYTRDLPAGVARIPLEFFGLILREKKATGPFQVKGLLGERLLNDDEIKALTEGKLPDNPEGVLDPLQIQYRTRAYRLEQFTDREFDSPEKRQRLRDLEAEVRQEAAAGQTGK